MITDLCRLVGLGVLAAFLAGLPTLSAQPPAVPPFDNREPSRPPPAVPDEVAPGTAAEGVEVQARGPVHEAFAQPSESAPAPGPVVPRQPPEPIPEQPPDQKPEAATLWIPGYWAWDDERHDYLWVSGFWRVPPAGRKWVPGYWNKVEGGWQWVSGFWANAAQESVPYMEPPPASVERGPSLPAPDDNSIYVPGCWVWRETRYRWRPGFWTEGRPGLVYCPPRYSWTPRGCVFVDGYWDRPLEDRGVLFAPAYFTEQPWTQPGWFYQPTYAVDYASLLGSLWVRPRWGQYCFGDYYGPRYERLGYRSWATYGRHYRDPLFGYYRWAQRNNPDWYHGLVSTYRGRVRGDLPLPPRTLVAQRHLLARGDRRFRSTTVNSLRVVRPLSEFRSSSLRLTRVSATEVNRRARLATAYHRASVDRRTVEQTTAARGTRPAPLSLARIPGPSTPARTDTRFARSPRAVAPPSGRLTTPSRLPRGAGPGLRSPQPTTPPRTTRQPFGPSRSPSADPRIGRSPTLPAPRVSRRSGPTLPAPRPSARIAGPGPAARPSYSPRPSAVRPAPRPAARATYAPPPAATRPAPRPAYAPRPASRPTSRPAPTRATLRPSSAPRPRPAAAARPAPAHRSAPRPAARPPARPAPKHKR